jgi:sulfate adenylyltransferase large subunit
MLPAPELRDGFEEFLQQDLDKELLRFSTAGSVDDGKSTLIGRLLQDAKGVYEDQLAAVRKSRLNRSTGPIDFSLLTDGLRAEREQGITIDVAYRYFQTPKRKFIIADTPGHEQYTRNMATGASTAHLAVILVDATKGLLPQTRRHSYIASLLGIPKILAAINKMDLMGYSEDVFLQLQDDFLALAERLNISAVQCVPVSALDGDNVVTRSAKTPWYSGPALLEHLETVSIQVASESADVRFPVQYVIRPDATFRGFAGQIAGGVLRPGDPVLAFPSRQVTQVQSIVTYDGELAEAVPSQSVVLRLKDEIDLSRGDMLVSPENPPSFSQRFSASIVWLHEKPLELDRTYVVKHTTRHVKGKVTRIRHRIDVNTFMQEPAYELAMNGIALVEVETSAPLFFDSYDQSRATGSFILIDALSNATVAAGMIREDLQHLPIPGALQASESAMNSQGVAPAERFERHGHRPAIFVIPNQNKFAQSVERALFEAGFEAIAWNADGIRSEALAAAIHPLLSAGYVVLLSSESTFLETSFAVGSVAGNALFDFLAEASRFNAADRTEQILRQAESLRIKRPAGKPGREG